MRTIQWLFPGWWRLFNEFQEDAVRLSAENARLRTENRRMKSDLRAIHLAATLPNIKPGIDRLEFIAQRTEKALSGEVRP